MVSIIRALRGEPLQTLPKAAVSLVFFISSTSFLSKTRTKVSAEKRLWQIAPKTTEKTAQFFFFLR